MDDPKKPRLDPLFDDYLRGQFPAMRTVRRAAPRLPPITFDFERMPLPPLQMPPLPPLKPSTLPGMMGKGSIFEEITALMRQMQLEMDPPRPLTKLEAALYNISEEMGYKPVNDTFFGLNNTHRVLLIDQHEEDPSMRLLAIGHELGHGVRFKQGKYSVEHARKWNTARRSFTKMSDTAELAREVMREEIMAWREGMRILRRVGAVFSTPRAVRETRKACLASYRMTTKVRGSLLGRLQIKEK